LSVNISLLKIVLRYFTSFGVGMKRIVGLGLIVSSVLLSGCGGSQESGTTQVAVKVNGEEVTINEFNNYLKRIPVKTQDEQEILKVKKQVLSALVDQKLLLEAAEKAEIDRSVDVISAIKMAENKIIVDAYIAKVLGQSAKPSEDEVNGFYLENNLIFKDRKQYSYDQYVVVADKELLSELSSDLKLLQKPEELVSFFEGKGVNYKSSQEIRTSDKLPKQLIKAMSILKPGDIGFFQVSDGMVVIGLNEAKPAPVPLEQVQGLVETQLSKQKRAESTKQIVTSLRELAIIEYNSDFKEYRD